MVASAPYLSGLSESGPFELRGAELVSAPNLDWPVPPIVTRAKWGADESLRKGDPIFNSAISKLIVHHTGTPNDITDYAGLARGILSNEVNNGYIDIAYNWLIDPLGRIYEGRWAQDYPNGAPHTGERDRLNVMGAHALHFNTDTIGIGLMGDYSDLSPTPAMVDALLTVMTWKCARWGLDPAGAMPYVNSEGARVIGLANICGHRDTYATACPGDTVEAMLPLLRSQVGARLTVGSTGYWIASGAGQLIAFGNLPNAGGTTTRRLRTPILGLTARPTGRGYWMFGADGGVFAFGDRAVLRFDRSRSPQPADCGHGADPDGARLLARRARRGRVLLRRREVLRFHGRLAVERARARAHAHLHRQWLLAVRA